MISDILDIWTGNKTTILSKNIIILIY